MENPWGTGPVHRVVAVSDSVCGANSSGHHRALQTPGSLPRVCNSRAYFGSPLLPLSHPPKIVANVIASFLERWVGSYLCGAIS